MTNPLAKQTCVPCEGGMPALTRTEAEQLLGQVAGWELAPDVKNISKQYRFKDFALALAFANAIGAIAEAEGHHPDLTVSWGKVGVSLSTHAVGGLSVNDFILAAKIEDLQNQRISSLDINK